MKRLLLLISLLLHAFSAYTGVVSGGGYAIVCNEDGATIPHVQLLDIYEGDLLTGFIMAESKGNLAEDYFQSVKRAYAYQDSPYSAEERRDEILGSLEQMLSGVVFLENPADLPVSKDLGSVPPIPDNCHIEQIAFYDGNLEKCYILQSRWNQLDSLNQAALLSHEIAYKYFRELGDKTSLLSRRLVAHNYAEQGPVSLTDGLNETSKTFSTTRCGAPYGLPDNECHPISTLWITNLEPENEQSVVRLQFSQIEGRPLLTKTWVDVPTSAWELNFGRFFVPGSDEASFGCIVQNPEIDFEGILDLQGTQTDGSSLKLWVSAKTNEPLQIAPVIDGKIGYPAAIIGRNYCRG
jgi:hypothetical protein